MTKEILKLIIDDYQNYAKQLDSLDNDFGIDLWQSSDGFISKIDHVVYRLTTELFQDKVDQFWDYILYETNLSFTELCEVLNIQK